MNVENYERVLEQIIEHPETWNQWGWHTRYYYQCATSHCIGGWGQVLSGRPANSDFARRDAREFFDISSPQADYLFSPARTLDELKSFPEDLASGQLVEQRLIRPYLPHEKWFGFNDDGYDLDGLDIYNKPRPA